MVQDVSQILYREIYKNHLANAEKEQDEEIFFTREQMHSKVTRQHWYKYSMYLCELPWQYKYIQRLYLCRIWC